MSFDPRTAADLSEQALNARAQAHHAQAQAHELQAAAAASRAEADDAYEAGDHARENAAQFKREHYKTAAAKQEAVAAELYALADRLDGLGVNQQAVAEFEAKLEAFKQAALELSDAWSEVAPTILGDTYDLPESFDEVAHRIAGWAVVNPLPVLSLEVVTA